MTWGKHSNCSFTKINTKFKDKNLEPDDFMSTFAVSKVR